jgi:hypothetical protein
LEIPGQELPTAVGCAVIGLMFVWATLSLSMDLGRLVNPLPGAFRLLVRTLVRQEPASSPKITRRRVLFAVVWISLLQVIPIVGFLFGGRYGIVVRAECGLFILAELLWVVYLRSHLLTRAPDR